jgi:D-aminoacyl-tRNA deacylase
VRLVLQRVSTASVEVDRRVVGSIGLGLVVLAAIESSDESNDVSRAVDKITGLRIFPDEAGSMNRSVRELGGSILLVSQFTLLGDVRRGRRPSFSGAAPPDHASGIFEELVVDLRATGLVVETGVFGAQMRVSLVNEGPVTIVFDVSDGRIR